MIGIADNRWDERPKAFIALEAGSAAGEEELIEHVRSRIAHHKAPDTIDFVTALPRTSTGKIHKYQPRGHERANRPEAVTG